MTICRATRYSRLVLLLASVLTGACSTDIIIDGDYPSALTRQLPYHVGLVLDDTFTHYTFVSSQEQDVTMSLGESQIGLFNQIFGDMFKSATRFNTINQASTSKVNLVVVPHVEEVQLAMPFETRLNVFEVWLKYNLQVFDSEGEPIADWLMTSYGKTQSRLLTSEKEALNQATTEALRDAGVRLVIGFHRVPEIQDWLASQQTSGTLAQGDSP
ncbi:MAG: hypothetical protein V7725_01480 [Porticoccus sp.]